jgi:hypothetical protein
VPVQVTLKRQIREHFLVEILSKQFPRIGSTFGIWKWEKITSKRKK